MDISISPTVMIALQGTSHTELNGPFSNKNDRQATCQRAQGDLFWQMGRIPLCDSACPHSEYLRSSVHIEAYPQRMKVASRPHSQPFLRKATWNSCMPQHLSQHCCKLFMGMQHSPNGAIFISGFGTQQR